MGNWLRRKRKQESAGGEAGGVGAITAREGAPDSRWQGVADGPGDTGPEGLEHASGMVVHEGGAAARDLNDLFTNLKALQRREEEKAARPKFVRVK